jgi:hypothetical protein
MTTPPMVTCGGCLLRRRSVRLWYLPRSGTPAQHVGLPAGWSIAEGYPFCAECLRARSSHPRTRSRARAK